MPRMVITSVEIVGGTQALNEYIQKEIEKKDQFKPYKVVANSKYASYVEYGTGPVSTSNPDYDDLGRTTLARIQDWVNTKPKFQMKLPAERKKIAYAIYRTIMENGAHPHPFLGPATIDVKQGLDKNFFNDGGTIEKIADMICQRAQAILEENDTFATGDLRNSLHVEEDKG